VNRYRNEVHDETGIHLGKAGYAVQKVMFAEQKDSSLHNDFFRMWDSSI
jgi:hypothetical protein